MSLLPVVLVAIYSLFLIWHRGGRVPPLTSVEIEAGLQRHLARHPSGGLTSDERQRLRVFFESDDGKPFWMLNLMKLRPLAMYPDGLHPEVKSRRHAHRLCARMVLKQLFRRGSYPVLVANKITDIVQGESGADAFEEMAIVRYRSRRDMLRMIGDPAYIEGVVHKWAALDTSVMVSTRRILLLDLGLRVPLVLMFVWLVARGWVA